ncbi:MAG: hypothetical protein GEV06_14980 [Luteitalea sp.]|nr:hypothetical protein [Luteitalea sp.]
MASMVADEMTALIPGAGPPPTRIASVPRADIRIRFYSIMRDSIEYATPTVTAGRGLRVMRRWQTVLVVSGLVLLVLIGGAAWLLIRATSQARERVVAYLEERLDSEVELAALEIDLWPLPSIAGRGLVVRHHGRSDVPPLVSIREFSADATFRGLLWRPLRVRRVRLDGLRLHVPPGGRAEGRAGVEVRPASVASAAFTQEPAAPQEQRQPAVVVDEILADQARLEIGTSRTDRPPRLFELHRMRLQEFAIEHASRFDALLTNPQPPGQVTTSGTFGPWNGQEPSATPLAGRYTFERADLGVFKGIDGTLVSRGEFGGRLERIDVRGKADVTDFEVKVAGNRVRLVSEFVTVVDGTNGNTELTDVHATWLDSALDAQGAVTGERGKRGRTVALDVTMQQAALRDVLQFAISDEKVPLEGLLDLKTRFVLPPGEADVIERLELDGDFEIERAKFLSLNVQKAIAELSRRGQGEIDAETGESVVSNLRGHIALSDGQARFSKLTFEVPGAEVRLTGVYAIPREWLDFRGELRLDATVSQTQEGWKRQVLRPFDSLLRRDGAGTIVPIKITGPRAKPKFGVEVKRIFRR